MRSGFEKALNNDRFLGLCLYNIIQLQAGSIPDRCVLNDKDRLYHFYLQYDVDKEIMYYYFS